MTQLNASDARGIDVVREIIKTFAETQVMGAGGETGHNVKLIILDEADAMTRDAQAALRRIMEKYSKSTRFCLICNYVSKIIPALQSRTTRFKFRQISKEDAVGRLKKICDAEKINITDQALGDIAKIAEGDMRKMVNTLQSIQMSLQSRDNGMSIQVDRNFVFKLTGLPNPEDIQRVFNVLSTTDDIQKAYEEINELRRNKGVSLVSLLKDISEILININSPGNMKGNIYKRMAEIEYRLSIGCSEEKQLASLIGAFVESRCVKSA
jgi:replication factor C subunit 3/5